MGKDSLLKTPRELSSYFNEAADYIKNVKVTYYLLSHTNTDEFDNNKVLLNFNGHATLASFMVDFSKKLTYSFDKVTKEISKIELHSRPKYIEELSQYLEDKFDSINETLQQKFLSEKEVAKGGTYKGHYEVPVGYDQPLYKDFDHGSTKARRRIKKELKRKVKDLEIFREECLVQIYQMELKKSPFQSSIVYKFNDILPKCLNLLHNLLLNNKKPFIDHSTGVRHFKKAFIPGSHHEPITWKGTSDDLWYLITQLESNKIIEFESKKKWPVVTQSFCKSDGSFWSTTTFSGKPKISSRAKDLDDIIQEVKKCIGKKLEN
ncbi:hypothetical protein [Pontibacter beigongshangensis]|uniref:hypothetical protein n=1 Tax=Pontibacter beigongshangensis TaxID=2574733 RepID=UPI00164FCEEE|nr:hypothetical protein [Pontibacter beigongshangensis]